MVNFMTVKIDDNKCDSCLECISVCPNNALTYYKAAFTHNPSECANCEVCMDVCPEDAIKIYPIE